jgi:hypothetical protein
MSGEVVVGSITPIIVRLGHGCQGFAKLTDPAGLVERGDPTGDDAQQVQGSGRGCSVYSLIGRQGCITGGVDLT